MSDLVKTAKDIMSEEVFTVTPDKNLNFVEVISEAWHIRHIPVIDDQGKPIAVLSVRDIMRHLSKVGVSHFIPIKEIMSSRLVTASPDTPISELAHKMQEYNVSGVPITADNKIVGMVTERDFLKLF